MQQKSDRARRQPRTPWVFVSHESGDVNIAFQVVEKLEYFGVRAWFAPRDVIPGKLFDEQIFEAITISRAVLLIFSKRVNKSSWVHREITVAGDIGKPIIPFRIEDADPKGGLALRLAGLHRIDGFDAGDNAVHEVLRTLRA